MFSQLRDIWENVFCNDVSLAFDSLVCLAAVASQITDANETSHAFL